MTKLEQYQKEYNTAVKILEYVCNNDEVLLRDDKVNVIAKELKIEKKYCDKICRKIRVSNRKYLISTFWENWWEVSDRLKYKIEREQDKIEEKEFL